MHSASFEVHALLQSMQAVILTTHLISYICVHRLFCVSLCVNFSSRSYTEVLTQSNNYLNGINLDGKKQFYTNGLVDVIVYIYISL